MTNYILVSIRTNNWMNLEILKNMSTIRITEYNYSKSILIRPFKWGAAQNSILKDIGNTSSHTFG